jgi:hypothetical protein
MRHIGTGLPDHAGEDDLLKDDLVEIPPPPGMEEDDVQ